MLCEALQYAFCVLRNLAHDLARRLNSVNQAYALTSPNGEGLNIPLVVAARCRALITNHRVTVTICGEHIAFARPLAGSWPICRLPSGESTVPQH